MEFSHQTKTTWYNSTPPLTIKRSGLSESLTVEILQRVEYQKIFRVFDTERSTNGQVQLFSLLRKFMLFSNQTETIQTDIKLPWTLTYKGMLEIILVLKGSACWYKSVKIKISNTWKWKNSHIFHDAEDKSKSLFNYFDAGFQGGNLVLEKSNIRLTPWYPSKYWKVSLILKIGNDGYFHILAQDKAITLSALKINSHNR